MSSQSLKGKVAIVTGSSRGIGAAVASALAKEGANVVINYVSASSQARAEQVQKDVEGYGVQSLIVQADLGSLTATDELVEKTVEKFGKIDILVNNGGILDGAPVGKITPEMYQRSFDVNVRSVIFLSQAATKYMGEGGRIINFSSVSARQATPSSTVYAASKAAVEAITRVMGIELRDKGIRVNAVNPGPTTTDMFYNMPAENQEFVKTQGPVADPSDIADIVVFLAGNQSRWITASTVNSNNGTVLF